jgi:hypothetical protein
MVGSDGGGGSDGCSGGGWESSLAVGSALDVDATALVCR